MFEIRYLYTNFIWISYSTNIIVSDQVGLVMMSTHRDTALVGSALYRDKIFPLVCMLISFCFDSIAEM
jgi:hypothetical protein